MNGYLTAQEVAEKWSLTVRQVQILCKNGRITGAQRVSRIWLIPESAPKPTRDRVLKEKDTRGTV